MYRIIPKKIENTVQKKYSKSEKNRLTFRKKSDNLETYRENKEVKAYENHFKSS